LAEVSLYYLEIFVGGSARFGFVSQRRVPSQRYWYSHYWFLKGVQLYRDIPSFTSSLSRKDERIAKSDFPQRHKWDCWLSPHTTCGTPKRESENTH